MKWNRPREELTVGREWYAEKLGSVANEGNVAQESSGE
jgi:hypothetical protein